MPLTGDRKREYQRNWIGQRRKDFFCDKACAKCGSREKLELHHIDPATKVAHAVWSWSAARRAAEIAKCVVLCRTCHHAHHNAELEREGIRHGSRAGYDKGCRCDKCRVAKTISRREERQRQQLRAS